ncbi:MAG: DUF503 domain-containing protein [Miltoncostaeaceae bacterium]
MECGHVGILTVDLHLPEAGSLKGKRKELLRVRNLLTRRLACSVAEVDHHDLWQRTRLTLCVADRTAGGAAARIEEGRRMLHGDEVFQVVGEADDLVPVDGEQRWRNGF